MVTLSCDTLESSSVVLASLVVGEVEVEAQRPHSASQAEASPRVDVSEVSCNSGRKAVRSFKAQNHRRGSNKVCFFVEDLTDKTLTVTSLLDSSVSTLTHDISAVTCIMCGFVLLHGGWKGV